MTKHVTADRMFGCISSRVCDYCSKINTDTICMCIGIFTCNHCGKKNDQRNIKYIGPVIDSIKTELND